MSLASISIRRPVATTMVMISMVFIGIVSMLTMKSQLLPNMNIPMVVISTTWSGAVPNDINSQITQKIEDSLSSVEGIKNIISSSSFEKSVINVEFDFGVDIDAKRADIQREVDTIAGELPEDASEPATQKVLAGSGNTAIMMSIAGKDQVEVSSFVEDYLTPRIERISGVGSLDSLGVLTKQIQVQFDTDRLSAYNLTPVELYSLISSSTASIPLGTIKTGGKKIVARFMGEFNQVDDFKNMIISSNGQTLRLGDVANVVLTTEDPVGISKTEGVPSVMVIVEKAVDGNIVEIADQVYKEIDALKPFLPKDTNISIFMDFSKDIKSSISAVQGNAVTGLVLATIILFIFLKNIRATLLISLALPIAIIFTFAFLASVGITLNVISLMGLSIGVGMLTDNSVVVIDNIYRHMTELKKPVREAADEGTTEVTIGIIASSLTTIVVFLPILFIPGMAKNIFQDMAYSVIFSNLAALIVSLTLMPMVASRFLKTNVDITKEGKVFSKVNQIYNKMINLAMANRGKTALISIAAFYLVVIVGGKFIKSEFMPEQDYGRYAVTLELEQGLTDERAEEITEQAVEIVKNHSTTKSYTTIIMGDSGVVNVDIGEKSERKEKLQDVMDSLREDLSKIPGVNFNIVNDYTSAGGSRDAEFRISADNLETAEVFAKQVIEKISTNPGISEITSSLEPGNVEARVVLDRDKLKAFGLNPIEVGQTISYAFLGGNRGQTVTVKTGTSEIDVLVRLSDEDRTKMSSLENLNVRAADGSFVKVSDIANIVMGEGTTTISKIDKIYYVSILANENGIGLKKLQEEILKAYNETNPPKEVSYSWGGMAERMNEVMLQMVMALGISIFLIYAILASQFESFLLPVIIIASIPLAVIGVYGGLLLTNSPSDIMVMIGIIMLSGTVVNNAIILIDFIKTLRGRGLSIDEAVKESCRTRLRPILMTTMTTVCGMIPMALGIGSGAELYSGMAIAVIFGLSFSTLLTLIVIPVFYTSIELRIENFKKRFNKSKNK